MARLARLLSRTAVGLVLAGGGARGFAHLGIWRALNERGVEIDVIGGTSIGAMMAALIAFDRRSPGRSRSRAGLRPTRPVTSICCRWFVDQGTKGAKAVHSSIDELAGGPVDIEDLWKGFFCVASNYSQAREQRIVSGDLAHGLLASSAIPGALPPGVRDGDLLSRRHFQQLPGRCDA